MTIYPLCTIGLNGNFFYIQLSAQNYSEKGSICAVLGVVSGKLIKFINYGSNVGDSLLTVASNCFFHGEKWTDAPNGAQSQFFGIKISASDNRDYSRIIGFLTNDYDHIYFRAIHSGSWTSVWKTII